MSTQGTLERWRSEKTASFLSSAVAAAEPDPAKAALFKDMAAAAEEQAGILAQDLGRTPEFTPSLRSRLIAKGIAVFGPRAMRPILSATKVRGVSVYSGKTEAPAGHPWPKTVEDIGKQHRNFGGGTLRAGVFGVNDGLVSNTCLVMGVAGAAAKPKIIVLTGVAGLLAGAFSMAAG
jgi:vacuolar iron transporter family protein